MDRDIRERLEQANAIVEARQEMECPMINVEIEMLTDTFVQNIVTPIHDQLEQYEVSNARHMPRHFNIDYYYHQLSGEDLPSAVISYLYAKEHAYSHGHKSFLIHEYYLIADMLHKMPILTLESVIERLTGLMLEFRYDPLVGEPYPYLPSLIIAIDNIDPGAFRYEDIHEYNEADQFINYTWCIEVGARAVRYIAKYLTDRYSEDHIFKTEWIAWAYKAARKLVIFEPLNYWCIQVVKANENNAFNYSAYLPQCDVWTYAWEKLRSCKHTKQQVYNMFLLVKRHILTYQLMTNSDIDHYFNYVLSDSPLDLEFDAYDYLYERLSENPEYIIQPDIQRLIRLYTLRYKYTKRHIDDLYDTLIYDFSISTVDDIRKWFNGVAAEPMYAEPHDIPAFIIDTMVSRQAYYAEIGSPLSQDEIDDMHNAVECLFYESNSPTPKDLRRIIHILDEKRFFNYNIIYNTEAYDNRDAHRVERMYNVINYTVIAMTSATHEYIGGELTRRLWSQQELTGFRYYMLDHIRPSKSISLSTMQEYLTQYEQTLYPPIIVSDLAEQCIAEWIEVSNHNTSDNSASLDLIYDVRYRLATVDKPTLKQIFSVIKYVLGRSGHKVDYFHWINQLKRDFMREYSIAITNMYIELLPEYLSCRYQYLILHRYITDSLPGDTSRPMNPYENARKIITKFVHRFDT